MRITEPRSVAPRWMEYVPIQSVSQLLSVVACHAIAAGSLFFLLRDESDPDLLGVICLGAVMGSLPVLVLALPQTFTIELTAPGGVEPMLRRIDDALRFRGYRLAKAATETQTRYVSTLPAILSWRENEFHIRRENEAVLVRGPRSSIGWLRKRLLRPPSSG